jgi:NADPH:quinone reductase-like Zn-dependent oxidoreductase
MAGRGSLQTKVEKSYSLNEIKVAVEHAARAQRRGKIIFEFGTR